MKYRTCNVCGKEKPETYEYFRQRIKFIKVYLRRTCRECEANYARKWRSENPELSKEFCKDYAKRNPEVIVRKQQKRRAIINGLEATLTAKEWNDILSEFNNSCAYCGRTGIKLTQDHVIPVSKGGTYTKSNIVPACGSCNSRKGSKSLSEFAATTT